MKNVYLNVNVNNVLFSDCIHEEIFQNNANHQNLRLFGRILVFPMQVEGSTERYSHRSYFAQ